MTEPATARCLACEVTDDTTPLIVITYRGQTAWICPQHMPTLIHETAKLQSMLPGGDAASR